MPHPFKPFYVNLARLLPSKQPPRYFCATNKFLPLPILLTTKPAGFVLGVIRYVLGVPAVLMVLCPGHKIHLLNHPPYAMLAEFLPNFVLPPSTLVCSCSPTSMRLSHSIPNFGPLWGNSSSLSLSPKLHLASGKIRIPLRQRYPNPQRTSKIGSIRHSL